MLLGNKKQSVKIAASITARYSDKKNDKSIEVCYKDHKGIKKVRVKAVTNEELAKWRL
jgi:hypothetical protein